MVRSFAYVQLETDALEAIVETNTPLVYWLVLVADTSELRTVAVLPEAGTSVGQLLLLL
jgi:hypothetical protein